MSYTTYVGLPNYEEAGGVTDRSAEELAEYYGYESVNALAESLPDKAEVIDVAAGFSEFGHTVAGMRPDIQWTNLDVAYTFAPYDSYVRRRLGALTESAPPNVSYVAADILRPTASLRQPKFNRIFNYFMLPPILLRSRSLGVTAVRNMLHSGTTGGIISTGPIDDLSRKARSDVIPGNQAEIDPLAEDIIASYSWVTD